MEGGESTIFNCKGQQVYFRVNILHSSGSKGAAITNNAEVRMG
jgi:hypothetical protein